MVVVVVVVVVRMSIICRGGGGRRGRGASLFSWGSPYHHPLQNRISRKEGRLRKARGKSASPHHRRRGAPLGIIINIIIKKRSYLFGDLV